MLNIIYYNDSILLSLLSLNSFVSLCRLLHSLVESLTDNLRLGFRKIREFCLIILFRPIITRNHQVESHIFPVLRPLPHLLGGVVASAGVRHLDLHQLVALLHRGHSLAVSPISGVFLKLLSELELNLGVFEAGQRL